MRFKLEAEIGSTWASDNAMYVKKDLVEKLRTMGFTVNPRKVKIIKIKN